MNAPVIFDAATAWIVAARLERELLRPKGF